MKRLLFVVSALLIFVFSLCASAQTSYIRDEADIVSEDELVRLEGLAKSVSEKHGIDVAVLAVETLGGEYEVSFADDYYGAYFGDDGVLLVYAVYDETRYVFTCGSCIDAIDGNLSEISEAISDPFFYRNYAEGFENYINAVDRLMSSHKTKGLGISVVISIAAGFIVAFVVTGVMKSQLDGARFNAMAENYLKKDSFKLTLSRDFFLYSTITRVPKPKNNSSHRSSSGRMHGGGRI